MCRSLSLNKGFDCRATVKPPVSGEFRMKSLYAAWLGDPGPGDLVEVECVCGHSQALTASMLATAGVGSPTRRSSSCSAASGAGSAMSGQMGDGQRHSLLGRY